MVKYLIDKGYRPDSNWLHDIHVKYDDRIIELLKKYIKNVR